MGHDTQKQTLPTTLLQSTWTDALWGPFPPQFMLPAKERKEGGYQLPTIISLFLPKGKETQKSKS